MLNTLWCLFRAELLLLLRRSQEWLYPLGFFLIVLSLFPIAFSSDPVFLQTYVPGCLWIAALLASMLAAETIFLADMEDGHMEQRLLSTVPFSLLLLTQFFARWLVTEFPLVLLTPLVGVLFHLSFNVVLALAASLLLGTPVLLLLGSLGVALTMGLRQQGLLLGVLLLPLSIPVLIFGVGIAHQTQMGMHTSGAFALLAALLFFSLSSLPWAIAATVRLGCDD